jgi:hypothetical protein
MDDKLWDGIECVLMSIDNHNEKLHKMNIEESVTVTNDEKWKIIAQDFKDNNIKLEEFNRVENLVNDGDYHTLSPNQIYINHGVKRSSIISKTELENIRNYLADELILGPEHKEMDEDLFELQGLGKQKEEQHVSPTGAKRNTVGKIPYEFLPLDLLDGASKVMKKGADKYGNDNFRLGFEPLHCLGSLIRHLSSIQQAIQHNDKHDEMGLLLDEETGISHVHHILTSTLILIQSLRVQGWKV